MTMKFIRNAHAPIPDYYSPTHRIWKSGGAWKIRRSNSSNLFDAERATLQDAKQYCVRDLNTERQKDILGF